MWKEVHLLSLMGQELHEKELFVLWLLLLLWWWELYPRVTPEIRSQPHGTVESLTNLNIPKMGLVTTPLMVHYCHCDCLAWHYVPPQFDKIQTH